MGQSVSNVDELIAEFRRQLPAKSGTAQAIDRREPFEQIALKAVDDGYIEFTHEFNSFMEVCVRRNNM